MFPMTAMVMVNARALAHVRAKLPTMSGHHWPHLRFLDHRNHEHGGHGQGRWEQLSAKHRVLIFSCCASWAAIYLCRSHVSALLPIVSTSTGLSLSYFSIVFGIGNATTAIGKVVNGFLADRYGGMVVFASSVPLAALTLIITMASPSAPPTNDMVVFAFWVVAFALNRWIVSASWGAMVLLLSVELPQASYGLALAIISFGYSLGDSVARVFYGEIVAVGLSWHFAFLFGAVVAALLSIPMVALMIPELRRQPSQETIERLNERKRSKATPQGGHREGVRQLMTDARFVAMTLSYSVFAVPREVVWTWTAVFFVDSLDMSPTTAATMSILLPMMMLISANVNGYVVDAVQHSSRRRIFLLQVLPSIVLLAGAIAIAILLTLPDVPFVAGVAIWTMLAAACEFHNGFIEGFHVVAVSAKVNRPASASGLIAFWSSMACVVTDLGIGAIIGEIGNSVAVWALVARILIGLGVVALVLACIAFHLGCDLPPTKPPVELKVTTNAKPAPNEDRSAGSNTLVPTEQ
ncbi:Major facilitator superfamily (MFS) profile domain-containing protein [Plasmodiophora brassicae]|nr:hypothetical protein PBRA_006408 [Plasmodiophora brassicae]